MNGAMEVSNKNIKKILVKMIDTYKDWHEYLPFALEAVLPAEVEIPSLRIYLRQSYQKLNRPVLDMNN